MTDHIDGIIAGMSEAEKRAVTTGFGSMAVLGQLVTLSLIDADGLTENGKAVRSRLEASNA